jgi:hypothetical protein
VLYPLETGGKGAGTKIEIQLPSTDENEPPPVFK